MAIAEIFLSAFLQVVFEKLTSAGISQFVKQKRLQTQHKTIKEWEKKLRLIEAMLCDAEQKQCHSNAVKLWLQDLRDLAFELEDVLDDFVTEARLHRLNDESQEHHHSRSGCCTPFHKVPSFLTCASVASYSNTANYSTSTVHISNRLQDILTQAGSLGLSQQTQSWEMQQEEQARTSSLIREPIVYGRDVVKTEIIQRLLKDEPCCEDYMVIPIFGIGGIGKTTLAQSVYNDELVKAHFDVKAWVCVSYVFDVKQITATIINSATQATENFSDLNGAQENLKHLLASKRFLIVLDDIWSDEYDPWDQLQTPFHAAAKGSRVIITTRIERVAKNMLRRQNQSPIVYLKGLSDDDCWLLFQQHALVDPDLVEIRNEVLGLFKGLPLAAKALGGLLRKKDKSKWPKILKSNIWSEECGVLPALRLSYHHLPQYLKRVFAYCSIFPKDHEFLEKDIVLMWMAEGLLPENEEESMEDAGSNFFVDLVSRSLLEPSPSSDGGCFIMHDLVHDLAQWAAGDICCTMNINKVSSRTRYFSFTSEVLEGQPWTLGKVSQLRTFAFFGGAFDNVLPIQMLDSIFRQFQYLRVLSMAHIGIITELPNCIGSLNHLRYLDLSFNLQLKELPESTSKLCNLQTLLLKDCQFLRKVVTNMELLTELRHLDIDQTDLLEMPAGIGKLTNLRTLNQFFLTAESGRMILELKNLKCLSGSLHISGLQHVVRSEDAKEVRLYEKLGLDMLKMSWGASTHEVDHNIERDALEQLQPHKFIRELELNGYRSFIFPTWLGNPYFTKMVVIRLEGCPRCENLPPLGQLPLLQELSIELMDGIKTVGLEFYGIGCLNPFPALKTLRFKYIEYWKQWLPPSVDDSSKVFPCLEELLISDCPLLEGYFPSHLPSLKLLDIVNCSELKVSLPICPLLQELKISKCKELSTTAPVICCSESLMLFDISQFTGIQGFWVQGVETLRVIGGGYLEIGVDHRKRLELVNCPKFEKLWPDQFGELNDLTHVVLVNCEELAMFLETNLLSSVKHLRIYGNNSLNDLGKLTNQTTCLEELLIQRCSSLISIGNLPLTLRMLIIEVVNIEQPAQEWGLHLLTCLKSLKLINVGSSVDSVQSIPDPDLYLPSSLSDLTIFGFGSLKSISCFSLPNLTYIWIQNCPKMSKRCIQVSEGLVIKSGASYLHVKRAASNY
ncbi:putative disease resistance RPP13-like protein 1 [Spinacia oleracea]|uniref:Disease resistance RPP13-like protein 1 n=1 Tax=Spinacia oleracea TaxID=3562 RepID=A0ABM3R5H5_SPIOL|nr:putative disease resistance RPP13-like protein 1 [Spinacia oleracea]XP_056690872.1 putative disease resistance RPP13-like protein 1 [Spinacia oleracea]XP_056690878.1 putative disease resistance RPP13-like protein 1 [Spinacia oleracea]XP_056690881.1 putative disease resistance RPP13-like protein 1 [Spinacia oleracea]XP_056690883.1 putative disease resistance RPP13-like protein 1 [Spinacia oleracea]XP_056690885.1 putative disease resistance RPP13-like protein 1 [Spinacia oleracea]XP_05669088